MNLAEQHERSVGNEIPLPDRFTKADRPPPHNMYYKLAICIETLRGPEAPRARVPSGRRVYSGVFLAPRGDDGMRKREGPGRGGKLCHGSARGVINATLSFLALPGAPRALIRMLIYLLRILPRAALLNGLFAGKRDETHGQLERTDAECHRARSGAPRPRSFNPN